MNVLQEHSPVLAAAWQRLVAAAGKQEAAGGEQHQEEQQLYLASSSVRSALRLLKELGLLPGTAEATQAAAAMTFNYLTINTYGYELQRYVTLDCSASCLHLCACACNRHWTSKTPAGSQERHAIPVCTPWSP
jgi:hypothetical protein